eukprot:c10567_g2_i1.p1 GENE.c10567_g2_i1~~c10567_g2_i1.p1  ORF type:complete len:776 (+),score=211.74 c10567_g2_i1:78-2405(+)
MADTSVKVVCRFRPFNDREKRIGLKEEEKNVFEIQKTAVIVRPPQSDEDGPRTTKDADLVFTLTRCLNPDTTQDQMYQAIAAGSMMEFFQGFNVTIFAYGQTGSGKSFSMFGDMRVPDLRGLVPRCCETIFNTIEKLGNSEFSILCSYCEIYQEKISDLLDPSKQNLEIRENPAKGVYVEDLSWEYVSGTADIYRLIALGDAHKVRRATKMNPNSSRSHCNFCIRLSKKEKKTGQVSQTDLNLVDLAGSERISKTGVTGEALEEAKKINLSLTTLSQCIHALTTGAKLSEGGGGSFVPFRQSKLTRLLQDSLGGNSKTCMLVACSPHPNNVEETVNSLRFAQRCANVRNRPVVNMKLSVEELEAMLIALQKELEKTRQTKHYEKPAMFDKTTSTTDDMGEDLNTLADKMMERQSELELKQAEIENIRLEQKELLKQIERKQLELDSLKERAAKTEDLSRRQSNAQRPSLVGPNPDDISAAIARAGFVSSSSTGSLTVPKRFQDDASGDAQESATITENDLRTQDVMITIPENDDTAPNQDPQQPNQDPPPPLVDHEPPPVLQATLHVEEHQKHDSKIVKLLKSTSRRFDNFSKKGAGDSLEVESRSLSRGISNLGARLARGKSGEEQNQSTEPAEPESDAKTDELEQQVKEFEAEIRSHKDEIQNRQNSRAAVFLRLDEQKDIIDRQKEVMDELNLHMDVLLDEREAADDERIAIEHQIRRVEELIKKLTDEREAKLKAHDDPPQDDAGKSESKGIGGAIGGAIGGTLGMFTKLW